MIEQLETEMADYLSADTFFSQARQLPDLSYVTIPVFGLNDGELTQRIQIATAIGIAVVINIVGADVKKPNNFGPYFDALDIQVDVDENTVINRGANGSQKTSMATLERVMGLLHQWIPQSLSAPIISKSPAWQRIELQKPVLNKHRAFFTSQGGLTYILPTVATPAIVNNAGTLTLTCATAGAAIFYTIDGRNPVPRSGTLYTAPFAPGAGKTVRVKAWLAGYQASAVATLST